VHHFVFLERYDMLKDAVRGGHSYSTLRWSRRGLGSAPAAVQEQIVEKKLKFYVIDAYAVAKKAHGWADKHGHANLFLRDFRRVAQG